MKAIKKTAATLLLLLAVFCLCSCTGYADLQEAEAAGAVMGEHISIDGANVSGMTVAQARLALEKNHKTQLAGRRFVIRAGDEAITVKGDALPIKFDVEEALFRAVSLSKRGKAEDDSRRLSCREYCGLEELRAALTPAAEQLERLPQDAKADFNKEACDFGYTSETYGRSVNVAELAKQVAASLAGGEFAAATSQMAPTCTLLQVQSDTQLIAEYSTSFSGSTYGKKGRVFNITKAAGLINGVAVDAGQEFDMNGLLGDRNAENGWKEATAIRDGAYTQEYGGGVCQVSTTLYNTVLMADLSVTERHHHSWPLGYVDIGRDATISTDGPNFRFINETEAAITVGAFVDEEKKTVTVRIYGRKSGEWERIELNSKKVESLAEPDTEYELDESLPYNTRVELRKARTGSVAETYKSYLDAEGNVLKKVLVCRDKYRSIKGLVAVSGDIYYSAAMVQPEYSNAGY